MYPRTLTASSLVEGALPDVGPLTDGIRRGSGGRVEYLMFSRICKFDTDQACSQLQPRQSTRSVTNSCIECSLRVGEL